MKKWVQKKRKRKSNTIKTIITANDSIININECVRNILWIFSAVMWFWGSVRDLMWHLRHITGDLAQQILFPLRFVSLSLSFGFAFHHYLCVSLSRRDFLCHSKRQIILILLEWILFQCSVFAFAAFPFLILSMNGYCFWQRMIEQCFILEWASANEFEIMMAVKLTTFLFY